MATKSRFDHEPVTHAVAHHLVAIAELLEEYGYARVSDVARRLGITRGSASITLKGLKQKGLVTDDDRRFLGLSDEGRAITDSIRAKKAVMKDLFTRILRVEEAQAELDTCQVEHVISPDTACRAQRLLDFVDSGANEVDSFFSAFREFTEENGVCEEKDASRKKARRKARKKSGKKS
ncbi:MAG: metal-dependent transcriptional regulator [Planctomycetota bacterium]